MAAVARAAVQPAPAESRLLMSGNDAVARAVWEAGVRGAAGYPAKAPTRGGFAIVLCDEARRNECRL